MRTSFIKTLVELAETDERIMLLTGDLGFMVLEPFAEKFPQRFINVGVAEQNMLGLATGLAEAGLLPFCYSIATFASLRPYEFFRNGGIHQQLSIRLVAVGGGFEYGHAGPSHHALEDIALMRVQPGLGVIVPADNRQTVTALRKTYDLPGPVYYRLGKDEKRFVPGLGATFDLGRANLLGPKSGHLLLVSAGSISHETALACAELSTRDIAASQLVISSISPLDREQVREILSGFEIIISVENHYINGGLGSLVAEIMAESALGNRLVRCGVDSLPPHSSGSESYYHELYGITATQLVQRAMAELGAPPLELALRA